MKHDQRVDVIIEALEDVKWSLIQHQGLQTLHLCKYPSIEVRESKWMIITSVCGQTFNHASYFNDIKIWKAAKRNGELCKSCQKRIESDPDRYKNT